MFGGEGGGEDLLPVVQMRNCLPVAELWISSLSDIASLTRGDMKTRRVSRWVCGARG